MKTILFAPATFNLGETTRMIEVAKGIQQYHNDKYNCIFFCFSRKYLPLIEQANFEVHLLTPILSELQGKQFIEVDQGRSLKFPLTKKEVFQRVRNELALINDKNTSLIITGSNITVFLSARIAKIPLVFIKPFAMSRPNFSNPNVIPRAFSGYFFTKKIWELVRYILLHLQWKPKAFKQVAKEYGLSLPKYSIDLLEGDINLITTDSLFLKSATLPANYIKVGAIFSNDEEDLSHTALNFISKARAEGKKIVYFAMGSSSNEGLILKVLNYLKTTDYYVIAPVKKYLTTPYTPWDRLLLIDFIQATAVNRLVDIAILHGGEGTIQNACASGKPFIGIPLQFEQEQNVSYCEAFGNAILLPAKKVNSKELQRCIDCIGNPIFTEKALLMQELMTKNGVENVVKWVYSYLN